MKAKIQLNKLSTLWISCGNILKIFVEKTILRHKVHQKRCWQWKLIKPIKRSYSKI